MRLVRLLVFPFSIVLELLLSPLTRRRRRKASGKSGWVELEWSGRVLEKPSPPRLPPWVSKLLRQEPPKTVRLGPTRRMLRELADDPEAKGLLLRMGHLECGYATAMELRTLIDAVRKKGIQIVAHVFENAGNIPFLIASGANRVFLSDGVELIVVGASASRVYIKDTLQTLGIEIEAYRRGRFKSAPETFTETEQSEFDRLQTKVLIDAIDQNLVTCIAKGRGATEQDVTALLDDAPYFATRAANTRILCDGLSSEDNIAMRLSDDGKAPPTCVPGSSYLERRTKRRRRLRRKKVVGVVGAHGAIMERPRSKTPFKTEAAIDRTVIDELRAAHQNRNVGAIVLHINSRGGGILASDNIYQAVKRIDQDKPVVACFGDVAASGGYYIACGARAICCSPLTVTGSIGVFAMMPALSLLKERLKLHQAQVFNRKNATLFDPLTPRTEAQKAHMEREVEAMYQSFLEKVQKARALSHETAHALSEGRVYTGQDALTHNLVDGLGGFTEAIERAKQDAGGSFSDEVMWVRTKGPVKRPEPVGQTIPEVLMPRALDKAGSILSEQLGLLLAHPTQRFFAYVPLNIE